jgi:microcystin-dependent protein
MSDPFLAEIRIFPFNFAPKGWAFCDGQKMPISQNTALFSLLSVTYGGDGKSNFALPDLQGRVAMHPGEGAGLSQHVLGEAAGTETVTLLQTEMPAHTHTLMAQASPADSSVGTNGALARVSGATPYVPPAGAPVVAMNPQAIAPVGQDLPHNNLQPYLTLNFCIALQGVFPQRQ